MALWCLIGFALLSAFIASADEESLREEAIKHLNSNSYASLKRAAQDLLDIAPHDGEAHYLLGAAYEGLGRSKDALASFKRSTEGNVWDRIYAAYFKLGNLRKARADWAGAIKWYAKTLKVRPSFFNAHLNMGVAYRNLGSVRDAIKVYQDAIAVDDGRPEAHVNIAVAQREVGQVRDAIASNKRALEIDGKYAHAHFNLGVIYHYNYGDAASAERSYRRAMETEFPDAYTNLASLVSEKGDYPRASELYSTAIAKGFKNARLFANYCGFLSQLGRITDAFKYCSDALKLDPTMASAYYNMANSLRNRKDMPDVNHGNAEVDKDSVNMEVIRLTRKALELDPTMADAYGQLGDTFRSLEDYNGAIEHYELSLRVNDGFTPAFCNLMYTALFACKWDVNGQPRTKSMRKLLEQIDAQVEGRGGYGLYECVHPYQALAYPLDLKTLQQISQHHARRGEQVLLSQTGRTKLPERPAVPISALLTADRRVRLGYISANFGDHPVTKAMLSIYKLHDRRKFKVLCFATTKSDSSKWRTEIQRQCDTFVDVSDDNDGEAAQRISSQRVYVLLHLSGYTEGERNGIFAARPAPVQVGYKGYCGTLGAKYIPHMITDHVVSPPDHAGYFTESMVYLPLTHYINNYRQAEKALTSSHIWKISDKFRRQHGIAADAFIFCSFNQFYKISPELWQSWLNILRRVPNSVLWLLRFPSAPAAEPELKSKLKVAGLAPERLLFTDMLPYETHLETKAAAELFLDAFVYNAHGTAEDSLWAAVPVLTLAGGPMHSRMAASLVLASGIPESVIAVGGTGSAAIREYEDIAVQLGNRFDGGTLHNVLIDERLSSRLFDTPRWVAMFERAISALGEMTFLASRAKQLVVL